MDDPSQYRHPNYAQVLRDSRPQFALDEGGFTRIRLTRDNFLRSAANAFLEAARAASEVLPDRYINIPANRYYNQQYARQKFSMMEQVADLKKEALRTQRYHRKAPTSFLPKDISEVPKTSKIPKKYSSAISRYGTSGHAQVTYSSPFPIWKKKVRRRKSKKVSKKFSRKKRSVFKPYHKYSREESHDPQASYFY